MDQSRTVLAGPWKRCVVFCSLLRVRLVVRFFLGGFNFPNRKKITASGVVIDPIGDFSVGKIQLDIGEYKSRPYAATQGLRHGSLHSVEHFFQLGLGKSLGKTVNAGYGAEVNIPENGNEHTRQGNLCGN